MTSALTGPGRHGVSFLAVLTCAVTLDACGRVGFERADGFDAGASDAADDSDRDGWSDDEEVACGADPSDPGDVPRDSDGDGICDRLDQCPAGDDLLDADQDGIADACEDLLVWLDADAAGSLSGADCTSADAATDTAVECWRDRSGYDNDLGRSTTDPPTVELSDGGLRTVRFTGPEALSGTVDEFPTGDPPFTSFVALFPATINTNVPQVAYQLGPSSCTKCIGLNFEDVNIRYYSYCEKLNFTGVTITNAPLLLAAWHEPGVYDNTNTFATAWGPGVDPDGAMLTGIEDNTQAPNIDANPDLWIGRQPGGFEPYDGAMGELMIFSRTLSETERSAIVGYLRAKWAL